MKKVQLTSGRMPFSFIAFSLKDAPLVENFIYDLQNNGFRFWFNAKFQPSISEISEISEKISRASVICAVLTPDSLGDSLVTKALAHSIKTRKPLLLYIPQKSGEIDNFISIIISKHRNSVVFRAYEESFALSNSAKYLLSQTLGFTPALAKKLFDTGLQTLRKAPHIAQKAMRFITLAASDGYTEAIFFLANIELEKARNNLSTYEKAVKLLRSGALLGDINCIYKLGCLIADGEGFECNPTVAFKYLSIAADCNVADAEYRLGVMYDKGIGVPQKDKDKATTLFKKSISHGDKKAFLLLGCRYLDGDSSKDKSNPEKAADCFELASENGMPEADLMLAKLYHDGSGVKKNPAKSAEYYLKAAVAGIEEAQYMYAICLRDGIGVRKNPKEAFKWFQVAGSEQPDGSEPSPDALFQLAECYEKGFGVTRNAQLAFYYYYRAAEKNHKKSMLAVSQCYRSGIGVPFNSKAYLFYKKKAAKAN